MMSGVRLCIPLPVQFLTSGYRASTGDRELRSKTKKIKQRDSSEKEIVTH